MVNTGPSVGEGDDTQRVGQTGMEPERTDPGVHLATHRHGQCIHMQAVCYACSVSCLWGKRLNMILLTFNLLSSGKMVEYDAAHS